MKQLHQYITHETFFESFVKTLAARYLTKAKSKFCRERGHRMAVYANNSIGMRVYIDGMYERIGLEALLGFLDLIIKDSKQNMTVLDVGANIGNHSVFFAKYFRKVLSFEPNPYTYQLLKFNSQFVQNIQTYNFGLGESNESLVMYEDDTNCGKSSAIYGADKHTSKVQIEVKRLDSIEVEEFGLIKIDVEGMEYGVLAGALNSIKDHMPIIVLEQLKKDFLSQDGGTKSTMLLENLGYKFCWLEKSNNNAPWFLRRMKNLLEIFRGRHIAYNMVTDNTVPMGNYSMLIALPPKYAGAMDQLV